MRPGAPTASPSLPGSPRGAAMAMVIMSPLSELTDTDGFEMHSASQRAPAPPLPPSSPGLSGPSVPGVGLPPSDGKAKFNSAAQPASSSLKSLFEGEGGGEAPLTHFWTPSGAPPLFFLWQNPPPKAGLKEVLWNITHFKKINISNLKALPEKLLVIQERIWDDTWTKGGDTFCPSKLFSVRGCLLA